MLNSLVAIQMGNVKPFKPRQNNFIGTRCPAEAG